MGGQRASPSVLLKLTVYVQVYVHPEEKEGRRQRRLSLLQREERRKRGFERDEGEKEKKKRERSVFPGASFLSVVVFLEKLRLLSFLFLSRPRLAFSSSS